MRGYAGLKAEDPIAATESLRMAVHLRPEVRCQCAPRRALHAVYSLMIIMTRHGN